ncbi:hypothetical protein [Nannocystis radixulma]|uniref:Uncharacterized protein n=1 Tax=Nannocystis radixulma TaxID=2995305 RepID=A0ABT5B9S1_9BACT|nr:hypothetical protein [Nannocystis radixulma]MDC0670473.1 hypothetical protein [Nannocystis radixulma]
MSAYAFLMVVDAARPSHADRSPRFPEIAHARGFVPLAWLALFEPDDLHVMPRRGGRATLTGFTTIARARENLARRSAVLGDMFADNKVGDRHVPILDRHLQRLDPERHVQLWTDDLSAPWQAAKKPAIAALLRGLDRNDNDAWTALLRAVGIRRDVTGLPRFRDVAAAVNCCVGWLAGEPAPGSAHVFEPILERFAEHFAQAIEQAWAAAIPEILHDLWWWAGEHDRCYAVVERLDRARAAERLAWYAALDPDPRRASERAAQARALASRVEVAPRREEFAIWPDPLAAELSADPARALAMVEDTAPGYERRALATRIAFTLRDIPPAWHADILAHGASAENDYMEGEIVPVERWVREWTAERCGGPPVIAAASADLLAAARRLAEAFATTFRVVPGRTPPTPKRVARVVEDIVAGRNTSRLVSLLPLLLELGEAGEVERVREAVEQVERAVGTLLGHDYKFAREVVSFIPGRAREADEDHLGVVDLAAWPYRSALVADGLTRDGEHTRALALANELLEDPPGTHECKVIGRLARTALHGHDDGPARLTAIATAALARLP